jgi:hypothetical protein
MRDLNQLAQQSIERRRSKLQGDVFVAERTIIQQHAPRGLGGNAVKAVLANYESVMKDLVEHCAERYRWIGEKGLFPNWAHTDRWKNEAKKQLQLLYVFCEGRLKQVLPTTGLTNEGMQEAYCVLLKNLHEGIEQDLVQGLEEARAEGQRATLRRGLSALQKVGYMAVGSAITLIGTYLIRK